MSGNGNQVPLAPSQRGPAPYPRAPTPHRAECYHPTAATGAYIANSAGGAQSTAQAALRVQPTPQPSAPPAPQQDISKTTMAGHNYVPPQNQTPQARPQYSNFQYRPAQHGTRPNTHPRQQQPYIPSAAATATGPVVYPTLVFQPTHMGIPQSYQQPRSQGYYQYMATPYISHTPQYYYPTNSQQLPTPNLPANAPGGRSNPTTLVGPQGTPATPTAPIATLPHTPSQSHMHQPIPGMRPTVAKRSHRLAIIDPVTQQDIFSQDNQYLSGDSSERQTPQPEPTPSIAEEFTRMVNEVANQPTSCESSVKSNYMSKSIDLPVSSTSNVLQPQSNAISSINNNVVKSEILPVNESKNLGPDVAVEHNETPVVSAISDSPVIVPKMPMNSKQLQKNSDQNVQPLVVDTNKNIPPNKQHKQSKSKPVVPQVEEIEKPSDKISSVIPQSTPVSTASSTTDTAVPVVASVATSAPVPQTVTVPSGVTPQPQRIRESRERLKTEDKEKSKEKDLQQDKDSPVASNKPNGPSSSDSNSSTDKLTKVVNTSAHQITSQNNQITSEESTKKQSSEESEAISETQTEPINTNESSLPQSPLAAPTATELLSAGIERHAKDSPSASPNVIETREASSAIEAQAKLTQSIASCLRSNQPEPKMKDINLNNKNTDPDTANGNTADVTNVKEDINKNERVVKNSKNANKKSSKAANVDVKETESYENGKDETDILSNVEQSNTLPKKEEAVVKPVAEKLENAPASPVFVPKYKYNEDQWSPFNKSGKKCYDIAFLKQIKDDPLSKNKPDVPLLETCNVIRTTPMQEVLLFTPKINTYDFTPTFAKISSIGSRSNGPRDAKKDGRNMTTSSKGSVKLMPTPGGSSTHKPVIHVSLSLREDVKLNETENAWKPSRLKKEQLTEDEYKTQELYKKFRGILNKLTPQKFDTLLDKVKTLEINNQKRLEGVIDLVFEKAIDEPNFSEAYANMCNKLSMLKVPADNPTTPDKCVNFRGLIISKCQNQFVTDKVDEQVLKLEKELAECTDPGKKKELYVLLEEENRRVRMRSVGNVRFIGELYKLKMLTSKIMVYCMNYLVEKLEEEKLECLCKLLTTIGQQLESEVKDQLDMVFKKMQEIVDRKSNKISSRVRFMIQDVIELRKRRWVTKSVVDSQPKMMDQIQKEAEQQQRNIELMNSSMGGGYRRDEGNRGKRGGEGRRQSANAHTDNTSTWKPARITRVDMSKLKAVTPKNIIDIKDIKLAPHNSGWNHGSGTKTTAQMASNPVIGFSKNKYSVLENVQADPTSLRGNKDIMPSYNKGASIERSTFRGDFTSGTSSHSPSIGMTRSSSGSRSTSEAPPETSAMDASAPPATVAQEPLTDDKKRYVKSMIDLCLLNPDDDEMVAEIKQRCLPQHHAAIVTEIINVAIEKSAKEVGMIAKSLLHLVSTNTISPDNFVAGLTEIFEMAPDLYIDIPMLYEYLGKIITPQIEKKHITFVQILKLCENVILSNQGHIFLKAIIRDLKDSMGPSFVKSKWEESRLQLNQWMKEDQIMKWIEDNKFQFLEGGTKTCEEIKKILTPAETQSKLLQLMNSDENCECIKGWVQDNVGKSSNEDWFMRALIQAICEHALFGPEGRDVPHFNQDRMNKYCGLINEFGETKQAREASCLFGIQQLVHRLEHPQGLTLEIFQYLHEQYIISVDGFIAWEESEKEPEGRGVMMKALTSFFTNIKEADNEDSCSED